MFRKAISLASTLVVAVVIVSSTANTQAPGGGPGAGGAPTGTAGGLMGHYQQLKFTLAPGETQTQPFVFPVNDAPIVINVSSSVVQLDCEGVVETYGPSGHLPEGDPTVRDSSSGRIFQQTPRWTIGNCSAAGGVQGFYSFDPINNTIIIGNESTDNVATLLTPVTITMTMWY